MARAPSGRGPSPQAEASRRGTPARDHNGGAPARDDRRGRGWDDEPERGGRSSEPAPWLDEGEYEDEGPIHTLIGKRALMALIFLLGVLTIGVVVGILLVSRRETTPIDVPGVGDTIPVLSSPGPWKVPPTGADIEGRPVEGQGQVLFGTGDGRETDARIALDSMPEDPMPRPGGEVVDEGEPVIEGTVETPAIVRPAEPAPAPKPAPQPAPQPTPQPARPKVSDTVVPKEVPAKPQKPVQPKVILAPEPAASGGQVMQLGAFSSESRARAAFKDISARYSYLAGMEPQIVPVSTDGKTLYRLRTVAPSNATAKDLCGRLKVAGEACSVVN